MRSTKRTCLALALAFGFSVVAYAECVVPPTPSKIPDGSTASEQEMLTAMQTLKEYNTDVETYVKCLEFEARQNLLSRSDQERMHNAAVETLQKIASKFNEQVRSFKAKKG